MTTRLDRLFVLLENGSSPLTRKAAAQQLGDVQRMHPHELYDLLDRVHPYLHNASWDCRIAASQAVEAIVSALPQWRPPAASEQSDVDERPAHVELSLETFCLQRVLDQGPILTSVEPTLPDTGDGDADVSAQRQVLNRRLGLNMAEQLGIDTSGIVSNEELTTTAAGAGTPPQSPSPASVTGGATVATAAAVDSPSSPREVNRQRRRQRLLQRQQSQAATTADPGSGEPPCKQARQDSTPATAARRQLSSYVECERWTESAEWPLEGWCDLLCDDLADPRWEVRHGGVTALRDTLKVHGGGAGRRRGRPAAAQQREHVRRLEDLALRLLRLLALDRLGDFVSDQVVAPVRETAAQALGAALHLAGAATAVRLSAVVLQLLRRPEWEVRHGGQLALRYLLAVSADQLSGDQLRPLLLAALHGLRDACDDVSAVAATCLISQSAALHRLLPADTVAATHAALWDELRQLDELSTCTPALMELLATLSNHAPLAARASLPSLVPRLWPFLGHSSSSVRRSAALTLSQLVNSQQLGSWPVPVVEAALRLTFQRCLLEDQELVLALLVKTWRALVSRCPLPTLLTAACPHIAGWLCLLMQPTRIAISAQLLLTVPRATRAGTDTSAPPTTVSAAEPPIMTEGGPVTTVTSAAATAVATPAVQIPQYIGGATAAACTGADREKAAARARLTGAALLGALSPHIVQPMPGAVYGAESPLDTYVALLCSHLSSKSALQRAVVGHIISEWVQAAGDFTFPETLVQRVHACLCETVCYDETAMAFTRLQQDCRDYISLLKHYRLNVDEQLQRARVLSFEQVRQLSGPVSGALLDNCKLPAKVLEKLQERRAALRHTGGHVSDDQTSWTVRTQMSLARAAVLMRRLTEKLNPVVRPLMESIKREADARLQDLAADSLVRLLQMEQAAGPADKIVTNLCTFCCCDPLQTPTVCDVRGTDSRPGTPLTPSDSNGSSAPASPLTTAGATGDDTAAGPDLIHGIITLEKSQQSLEERGPSRRGAPPRTSGGGGGGGGGTSTSNGADGSAAALLQTQRAVQRRGACHALEAICRRQTTPPPARLLELSLLWLDSEPACQSLQQVQLLINALQVTEVVTPTLPSHSSQMALSRLPRLLRCLRHQYKSVRHMAARCLAAAARLDLHATLAFCVQHVLPLLGDATCVATRQGAVEAVTCLLETLWLDALPYIVLMVVPLLGRMSDRDAPVRLLASRAFGAIIQLMPLEPGCKGAERVPEPLQRRRCDERRFLDQLMDPASIDQVPVPDCIRAELRPYQRRGISWLAFLNKYRLHGVLCDDMGLGKSLQSLCMLVADHRARWAQYERSGAAEAAPLPSLIVCPPTLTGHWMYEVDKFVDWSELQPLHYHGMPADRQRLQARLPQHNLVIASYDIVRNDLDWFAGVRWNYCVLDEGHMIKNGKTKVARAIKQLDAVHRLILTGTPLQNSVLELWSLFDFLMPGFLGTERQFTARYSRPILQSRDAKANSREQEAGALAMESLHRQVLPFLLRRLKEDVLDDLPPKITQDYYCELSDVQKRLYEQFASSQAQVGLVEGLDGAATAAAAAHGHGVERAPAHVFQALQYLRKVCNHPKLVLTPQHPSFAAVQATLRAQNTTLDQVEHSAKLVALRQLLLDLGIGGGGAASAADEPVVPPHRALIFCQLKSMVDLVETDLLRRHLPGVTYLRLDGSVPAGDRQRLVHRFNTDPSIDCLLLTTQVGGLGLNLVGADTVVFVEHDWNPMKDVQAMDRAHRIGQRRVVNVYRLITRGTLEEKIMGLQKFKLMTANTVITADNSSLLTMGTDQLFDLFTLEAGQAPGGGGGGARPSAAGAEARGIRAMLESLPELWEGEQYEQEYDLSSFMKTLRAHRHH